MILVLTCAFLVATSCALLVAFNSISPTFSPTLIKNVLIVGCAIIVKETVNLNKLKNQMGEVGRFSRTLVIESSE